MMISMLSPGIRYSAIIEYLRSGANGTGSPERAEQDVASAGQLNSSISAFTEARPPESVRFSIGRQVKSSSIPSVATSPALVRRVIQVPSEQSKLLAWKSEISVWK